MEQLSVDEGLPHTDVSSIVQDDDGYIWLGTYSGLCRYDGNDLTSWDMSNSILKSSRIRSLRLIGDLLYVGTENGGLTIYDTERDKFVRTISVSGNCVNAIFPSADSTAIWLCTNDGVSMMRTDDEGYSLTSWQLGSVCLSGCSIGGEIIVGTSAGIGVFNGEDGLSYIRRGVFATSMMTLSDYKILITAYEGTYVYNINAGEFSLINLFDSRSSCLDGNGGFYVGTAENGVLRYSEDFTLTNVLSSWNSRMQMSDIEISALLFDRSRVLWIGTNGSGCFRSTSTNRAFKILEPFQGNGRNQLVFMYADSKDRLWVTSRDGRVAVLNGGKFNRIDEKSLAIFRSMPVSSVRELSDGSVWLGSWDYGVGIIDASEVDAACAGKAFNIRRPLGLPEMLSVYKFVEDDFGSVWMTTASGVWRSECGFISNGKRNYVRENWMCFKNVRKDENSLSDDFTTDILADGNVIWVGSRASLNRFVSDDSGKIIRIDRVNVRSEDNAGEFVSFIHKSADDSLWVSVLGLGLAKLTCNRLSDSLSFKLYNKSNCPDFPNNEFESLLEDADGNFWMGGFGLIRFSPKTLAVKSFTRKDGLQSNAFKIWDAASFNNGEMAFGGISGFNIFNPGLISDNPVCPKVQLTSLSINGEEYISTDGTPLRHTCYIRLSHRMNSLVFRFSSMHYSLPEKNSYRYKMQGIDGGWHTSSGLNPSASYINLSPGKYRFMVYGSNSDGVWSSVPAELEIRISHPWYSSLFAEICYAVMGILIAVVLVVYFRRRNEKLHARELEDRLKEEQRERNENELKFHTEFLHEIRTPLTLITTPVEELLNNPNLGKTTVSRLQLVDQSAKILQKHIESVTDLRRYDNGEIRLHVVEVDFTRFSKKYAFSSNLWQELEGMSLMCLQMSSGNMFFWIKSVWRKLF